MRRLIFHQLGKPAGQGERTGLIMECGCVHVSVQTAGGLELCPSQGESLGAALNEPEGRPDQTLAQAAQMGILPLPAARCEHHHVPHLLQGTAFIRHTVHIAWCGPQTKLTCLSFSHINCFRCFSFLPCYSSSLDNISDLLILGCSNVCLYFLVDVSQ